MAAIIGANNPEATMNSKEEVDFTYKSDPLPESRASELQVALPELLPALKKCGVSSCSLDPTESILTASITKFDCQDNRALHLLQLLATTTVPPSLAIELALHDDIGYCIIKIGLQKGGIARKYGINKRQFSERREHLKKHYLEALEFLTDFHLYLGAETLTVVGTKDAQPVSLGTLTLLVEQCTRYGPDVQFD